MAAIIWIVGSLLTASAFNYLGQ